MYFGQEDPLLNLLLKEAGGRSDILERAIRETGATNTNPVLFDIIKERIKEIKKELNV